ncbi:MAG: FHA domain-containing protein [Bdellovibrionales bacterium]|nr:FHA domain-containing protein [Bdellovibrionales bacterium]
MTIEDEKNGMGHEDNSGESGSGSRARNRTVMLTPEITGEVRARLAQDMAGSTSARVPGLRKAGQTGPVNAPVTGGFSSPAPQEPRVEQFPPNPFRPSETSQGASQGFEDDGFTEQESSPAPRAQNSSPAATQERVIAAPKNSEKGVVYTKLSPVAGFLVSYDEDENGEIFELRMGRLIVTSEPPGAGNFLVLDDDSVSSMHAIVRVASFGEVQILDQLSEFGTRIVRGDSGEEEELSGDKSVLHHGDVVFFGERKFHLCLITRE